ncbi:protein-L-isoaspartate(D-aspartate) O-methyltransferase [bacterium]|nr:protein-L-isoaspartate(D-aspartate) O-methyltransferase [bacterium]
MNYDAYRDVMIEKQLKGRGITNELVLEAMSRVSRHDFVTGKSPAIAYGDFPVYIGNGQTISQPFMVALMSQKLEPFPGMKVLEIGTGSGYQTAILAAMGGQVYTIERIAELGLRAQETLQQSGYGQIEFRIGDGTKGWPEQAPFDRIIVTAAAPDVPRTLSEQLKPDAVMVIPVGDRYFQTLKIVSRTAGKTVIKDDCGCVFVKLIGEYGWIADDDYR